MRMLIIFSLARLLEKEHAPLPDFICIILGQLQNTQTSDGQHKHLETI